MNFFSFSFVFGIVSVHGISALHWSLLGEVQSSLGRGNFPPGEMSLTFQGGEAGDNLFSSCQRPEHRLAQVARSGLSGAVSSQLVGKFVMFQ